MDVDYKAVAKLYDLYAYYYGNKYYYVSDGVIDIDQQSDNKGFQFSSLSKDGIITVEYPPLLRSGDQLYLQIGAYSTGKGNDVHCFGQYVPLPKDINTALIRYVAT